MFSVVFAQTPSTPASDPTPSTPPVRVSLENPLNDEIGTIQDLLVAILNIVIILMIPIIVFFIILAGFKYVTARGNASQVEEATRALTYAIIGGVLVLGAVALSEIIKNVVDQFAA
jgi:hypothetical protein